MLEFSATIELKVFELQLSLNFVESQHSTSVETLVTF